MNKGFTKLSGVMSCLVLALALCGCATKHSGLLLAAESDNANQVKSLLADGADINVRGKYGRTPLHVAADKGYKDVAGLLITGGADVSAQDSVEDTPLHVAAYKGQKEIAELLIARGADVNAINEHGATPLYVAAEAYEGGINTAELLIAKGADVNAKDNYDETPLHAVAEAFNGDLHVAELLVAKGANVNAKNKNDETPLYAAAQRGHKEIAELLIAKGADVNAKNKNDNTPLHAAAEQGRKEIVELLIAKGADVNSIGKNDDVPLNVAVVNNGHKDAAKIWGAKDGDISAINLNGDTPHSPAVAANKNLYGYLDFGIISYSNAPKGGTDGLLVGGGYHFNPHWAVEAGLSIIKDSTSDSSYDFFSSSPQDSLSADSYQIAAVGTLPLNDQYDLFGKLGWAYTSLSYTYSYRACGVLGCYGPTVTGSGSASKTNPMFAIGWQWKLLSDRYQPESAQHLKFRVQYENFGKIKMTTTFSDNTSNAYDIGIEVLTIGIVINF